MKRGGQEPLFFCAISTLPLMKYNSERSLYNESLSKMGGKADYQRKLCVHVGIQRRDDIARLRRNIPVHSGTGLVDTAQIHAQQDQVFY